MLSPLGTPAAHRGISASSVSCLCLVRYYLAIALTSSSLPAGDKRQGLALTAWRECNLRGKGVCPVWSSRIAREIRYPDIPSNFCNSLFFSKIILEKHVITSRLYSPPPPHPLSLVINNRMQILKTFQTLVSGLDRLGRTGRTGRPN